MRNNKDPCLYRVVLTLSFQTNQRMTTISLARKKISTNAAYWNRHRNVAYIPLLMTKNVLYITQLPHNYMYTLLTTTKQILCWQKAPQQPNMDTIRTKAPKTIKVKDRPLARSPTFRAPKDNCCNRGRIWSLMTSTSTSIKIPGMRRPSPSSWKQWVLKIFTDLLRVRLSIYFELIGLFSYLGFFMSST